MSCTINPIRARSRKVTEVLDRRRRARLRIEDYFHIYRYVGFHD